MTAKVHVGGHLGSPRATWTTTLSRPIGLDVSAQEPCGQPPQQLAQTCQTRDRAGYSRCRTHSSRPRQSKPWKPTKVLLEAGSYHDVVDRFRRSLLTNMVDSRDPRSCYNCLVKFPRSSKSDRVDSAHVGQTMLTHQPRDRTITRFGPTQPSSG
ncbi:hypothetical protein BHE74_00038623 [Ensete ventricosum]|nr:hypothetical protein BHE74_00038623 [Ensete ventricosum]